MWSWRPRTASRSISSRLRSTPPTSNSTAIDVEAFALLRAVAPPVATRTASALRSSPSLSVTIARRLRSPTVASVTSRAFSSGVAVGSTRLRPRARSHGRRGRRGQAGPLAEDDDPSTARARNAVKHELTTLARELVASLQFYQAQPDSLALSEILVTGGTTRMPGFVEEIERLVRARVRPADPLAAVQADGEHLCPERPGVVDDRDRIGGGAVMDAVNLLPLEHKVRAKKRSTPADNLDGRKTLRTGGLAALAVLVLLGALYGYERSVVNAKKSALAKDQAALAEDQAEGGRDKGCSGIGCGEAARHRQRHDVADELGQSAQRLCPDRPD